MGKAVDITGKRFGRLVVLKFDHAEKYRKYYLCKCDCGNTKIVLKGNLLAGYTLSCGCLQKERASKASLLPNDEARLHRIFGGMKHRCYDEKHNRYPRYGGRGIKICKEWLDNREEFVKWSIENGYAPGLSIDRIDNNGDYSPNNCRWVKKREQGLNMSRNVVISYNGESMPLKEWARKLGIKNTTLHNRLKYLGWSVEKAFTTPVRGK